MVNLSFNPNKKQPTYIIRNGLFETISKHKNNLSGDILDFGCGSKPYKNLFNYDTYVGLDFEGEGHSHETEDIDVYYDGITLPFDDNSFDSIFSSEVFEHVFNLEQILKELYRVLKPGGKMMFTCPFVWIEHEAPNDYARYTQFALNDLLHKANFKINNYEKIGTYRSTLYQLKMFHYWYYKFLNSNQSKIPIIGYLKYHYNVTLQNNILSFLERFDPSNQDLYLNNFYIVEK